jgi:hypothetical protein
MFPELDIDLLCPDTQFRIVGSIPIPKVGNAMRKNAESEHLFATAQLTKPEVPQSINCFMHQFERELPGRHFPCQRRGLT